MIRVIRRDKKLKETVNFVKQKLGRSQVGLSMTIKSRVKNQPLLRTMEAILNYQKEFFLDGD